MRSIRLCLLVTGVLSTGAVFALAAPPQSPIKFENAVNRNLPLPNFGGYPALVDLDLTTLSHSAGAVPAKKEIKGTLPNHVATLTINNEMYQLDSFHFHKPQEHVLGLNNYPLELHLVHKHVDTGKALAVGLWIEPTLSLGDENAALSQIHANLPTAPNGPGAVDDPDGTANFANFKLTDLLLTDQTKFFGYNGSLTTFKTNAEAAAMVSKTPVRWIMFKDPLKLTQDKIDDLADHPAITGARPTQPIIVNRHRLAMYMEPVPEPSTVWLLAVAGLVAGLRRRR